MAYSVEHKAMAIAILERHGGMTGEALAEVRTSLGRPVSKSTLHGWLRQQSGSAKPNQTELANRTEKKPVPQPILDAAHKALDDLYEQVTRRYLERALDDDVIDAMKGKEAVTAAAIATDKMRLLRDMPTEIVRVLPRLIAAAEASGFGPDGGLRLIEDLTVELESGVRDN